MFVDRFGLLPRPAGPCGGGDGDRERRDPDAARMFPEHLATGVAVVSAGSPAGVFEHRRPRMRPDVLRQLTEIARREQPDAIILAGDIYDKSLPSAEAVCLFDAFLTALREYESRD